MNLVSLSLLAALAFAPEGPAPQATPTKVQAALPELERVAKFAVQNDVPGLAVAIVHQDKVVYAQGFGARGVGERFQPVDADTVFQLASVSKPVATTVLARLVGEGVIGWDDRVADRLPGFQLWDPYVTRELTLRDLLCHRSGLPDHAGDLLEDIGYGRDEVLRRLRFQRPGGAFRSHYAYTNFGFTAAGEAGARAAGKSWEDLSAEKLYRPLGMKSTSSRHADFLAAPNRAKLHVKEGDRWVAKFDRQPDAQSPAGGVSSSANDMAQWLRLQLADGKHNGQQLIAAKALAETHAPQAITGHSPDMSHVGLYCLGWNLSRDGQGRTLWRHSGAFSMGASTEVVLLPSEQLAIVTLTNGPPVGIPEGINDSFLDLALNGKLSQDWLKLWRGRLEVAMKAMAGPSTDATKPPVAPEPQSLAEAYEGKYANDFFGAIEVAAEGRGLVLKLGPQLTPFPLRHWDRDTYLFEPTGESASGPSAVSFLLGTDRIATSVTIQALNADGEGVFARRKAK